MESTPSTLSSTAETANPLGAYVIRKRPLKSMRGIGFIPLLWVATALQEGLFPSRRSYCVASIIARSGDCDGRYCYLFLKNMVERGGRILSESSIKRGVNELVEAGLVRKLTRQQTRTFFAQDIAEGRKWGDRLPNVLELLIPAEAYPEQVLAEINQVRAELGEEPLDETTRPYPSVGTTGHIGTDEGADCTEDCCHSDLCSRKNPASVRDCVCTGGQDQKNSQNGPYEIIARIHHQYLSDPVADRERLTKAVDDLLDQGLSVKEARALFSGLKGLDRPFPALMSRMRDLRTAQAFLSGSLGKGINASASTSAAWSTTNDAAPFSHPEQFLLDSQGKANYTCPDHWHTRNEPGGTCAICGRLCRSVPGEVMHDPVAVPAPRADPRSENEPAYADQDTEPSIAPGQELDPQLKELMVASLQEAGRSIPPPFPLPGGGFWTTLGSGISPKSRTLIAATRRRLQEAPRPEGRVPHPRCPPESPVGTDGITSAGAPGGG